MNVIDIVGAAWLGSALPFALWYSRKKYVEALLTGMGLGDRVTKSDRPYFTFVCFCIGLFWPVSMLIFGVRAWYKAPVVKHETKKAELAESIKFWEEYRQEVTRKGDKDQRDLANTVLNDLRAQR